MFTDSICGADLSDMQLISKFNKGILLCVFDIFSKYTWLIPLKNNKGITITNAFRKLLNDVYPKLNEIWVDLLELYRGKFINT